MLIRQGSLKIVRDREGGGSSKGTRAPEVIEREVLRMQAHIDEVRSTGLLREDEMLKNNKDPKSCAPGYELTEAGQKWGKAHGPWSAKYVTYSKSSSKSSSESS